MLKHDITEIICVIDKSGSMDAIKSDAIGGFNNFLEAQKKEPEEAIMTVVLFDTNYEFYANGQNIKNVKPFDNNSYQPGGCTALLDAVGRTIDEVGRRLSKTPEADRPGKVIFVILTDGEENSSVEYSREQILEKIRHQTEKYSWQFLFLAANQDAIATAGDIGIQAEYAVNFDATEEGISKSYKAVNCAVSSYRKGGAVKEEWKKEIE